MLLRNTHARSLLVPVVIAAAASVCHADAPDVSEIIATRIAHRDYAPEATLEVRSERRGLLVTFQRRRGWGELRYLLTDTEWPDRLRVIPLQDMPGNFGGTHRADQEKIERLFSEQTAEALEGFGRDFTTNVFEPPPDHRDQPHDFQRRLVPTVAKYTLRDAGDLGRGREWQEVLFRLEAVSLVRVEFKTNIEPRDGENIISLSVYVDEDGIPLADAADAVIHVRPLRDEPPAER